jgi:regulatory LuxR family protein
LLLPLPCQATPSISSTKAIAASAGLGAVDFLCVFGIRNKSEKSNSEPGTQFSAFYSGFHSRADHCLPTLEFHSAGEGMSSGDIAAELTLSEGTVRNYLSEAISKMGAGNRVEAARMARTKGWL